MRIFQGSSLEYIFNYGKLFANEFKNYPQDQQNAILDFLDIYEVYGLKSFKPYKGKITFSWKGLNHKDPAYQYAKNNDLWHIHIGLPSFRKSAFGQYYTSDMILHFQWINKGNVIKVVDVTPHYKADRQFWLPTINYLK